LIDTIIFDFGGVISKLDPFPRVSAVFEKRYGIDKELFYKKLKANDNAYLLGNMSTKEFWRIVCADTPISYDEFEYEIAWFEINQDVLQLIRELKEKYKMVILSDCYIAIYEKILRHTEVTENFSDMFYSNILHMSKAVQKEKMFEYVLEKIHKNPDECIFIDDKEVHVNTARNVGIRSILFKDINQLRESISII